MRDLIAGCSIAGLLLPEAVAYAGIANLPPQAGLIGLLIGLVIYGLLGTSRFAVVSATSSSAAVLAAITVSMAGGDLAQRLLLSAGLVILSGFFLVLAGLSRLGGITEFIAKPVLRGFTFGLAITIILKQVAGVAGVHPTHGDLPRFTFELVQAVSVWNVNGLIAALVVLLLLFAMSRWKNLPGPLVAIVLGIVLAHVVDLNYYGIRQVGTIDLADVSFGIPDLPRTEWLRLGELAFALVLILYAESYGSIRSLALKHGDKTSANRDLVALGLANVGSGLLHGMPVGAGYSATSANEAAGARSRLAGGCAAIVVAVIVALFLPQLLDAGAGAGRDCLLRGQPYTASERIPPLLGMASGPAPGRGGVRGRAAAWGTGRSAGGNRGESADHAAQFLGAECKSVGAPWQQPRLRGHHCAPRSQDASGVLIVRPEAPIFFANIERVLAQVRHLADAGRAPCIR